MILSVLLPNDVNNLISFFNIIPDINNKLALYDPNSIEHLKFASDLVSIVPANGFDEIDIDYSFKLPCSPQLLFDFNSTFSSFISSITVQLGFHLNINNTYTSAGIDKISQILTSWSNAINKNNSNLILGIELGGVVEIPISDQCHYSTYAYWAWENLSSQLSPSSCPTNLNPSSQWTYGFIRIAIADITKDPKDLQLTNFILGKYGTSNTQPPSSTSTSSQSSFNVDAVVGGVIGSLTFISVLVAAGFILYRKYGTKMSNPLIDTNNQAYTDTNYQFHFDINRQVRSDTNNRIYSDTNHKAF
ncbi:15230_t:CDS:2 [Cetraspora pellucida]|uniref:15230_t:CDS:1 n=1 Tax=Cetraspora pellucida TaxID=1433469 RepID=A0A9N8YXZ3_9GLOM|nr:15230_t:CDS:2 [Cetraspora pellucida]